VGTNVQIALLRPDDLFGFEAALGKHTSDCSVIAVDHGTEVLKVPQRARAELLLLANFLMRRRRA